MEMIRKKTLAECHIDLELICQEIDANDGEINDEMMARFEGAQLELKAKVDNWISYMDSAKGMVEVLRERRDRIQKAYKSAMLLQERLKGYVKFQIEARPDVPMKGSDGQLYLHKNPKGLEVKVQLDEKMISKIVSEETFLANPGMEPYISAVSYMVLDTAKVKADLLSGMEFGWAEITTGSHVRTKA